MMNDINDVAKALRFARSFKVCEDRSFRYDGMKEPYNVNKLLCDSLETIETMSSAIHDMYFACIDAEETAIGKLRLVLEDAQ